MNLLAMAVEKRPTEIVSGLGLAAAVYGFLTKAGVPSITAAIIAIVIAFVPAAISEVVDHIRGPAAIEATVSESSDSPDPQHRR